MAIDEAIKRLTKIRQTIPGGELGFDWDALQLGIEALKVVKEFRTGRYKTINSPLLGETEE